MDVFVRVMLKDDEGEPFMGIGVVWLLRGIEKHHSISQAARDMELSYPKALRMIQTLEDTLGMPMVRRYKGGHQRGGAELTSAGHSFVGRYVALLTDIQDYAGEAFARHFRNFGEELADEADGGEADAQTGASEEEERPSQDGPSPDR